MIGKGISTLAVWPVVSCVGISQVGPIRFLRVTLGCASFGSWVRAWWAPLEVAIRVSETRNRCCCGVLAVGVHRVSARYHCRCCHPWKSLELRCGPQSRRGSLVVCGWGSRRVFVECRRLGITVRRCCCLVPWTRSSTARKRCGSFAAKAKDSNRCFWSSKAGGGHPWLLSENRWVGAGIGLATGRGANAGSARARR